MTFFINNYFDLLNTSRDLGWVKGQNICLPCVLCFIPINIICNMTIFRRKKWPFDPTRVCVRAKYLLACFCMLHSLYFYMQHDHILKKLTLYKPMWPLQQGQFWPQGHNLNKLGRGSLDDGYIPKIKALDLRVSNKKIVSCCHAPCQWNLATDQD